MVQVANSSCEMDGIIGSKWKLIRKDRRELDHVRGRWQDFILTTAQVTRELRTTAMEFEGGN